MDYSPSGEDFRQARERLKSCINHTPLLRAEVLERDGRRVYIKTENLQRTGSFKARGAFNALASLPIEARQRGVIAFSSGNHGAAIAFAAQELGMQECGQGYPCTVVMPERANPVKVARIKSYGAEVIYSGSSVEDRQKKAEDLSQADGRTVIPSYDDSRIIVGQGTLAGEMMDQWMGLPSRTRRLYLFAGPVGGGGLMAGVSSGLRARGFGGRIVGIEPEDANDTQQSLAAGQRVSIQCPMTLCDGLRSTTPGALTFPILKKCLEGIVTVSDEEVLAAVTWLLNEMKLLVEPSGAVAVAAWMNGKLNHPEHDSESPEFAGDVVLIVSGGNVDPKLALSWLK